MAQPEQRIKKAILEYLAVKRIFSWSNKTQGTYDPKTGRWRCNPSDMKGVSDILGIFMGDPLAIEVKTPKGILSDAQRDFISKFNLEGGHAFVARSIDDVESRLNEIKVIKGVINL